MCFAGRGKGEDSGGREGGGGEGSFLTQGVVWGDHQRFELSQAKWVSTAFLFKLFLLTLQFDGCWSW